MKIRAFVVALTMAFSIAVASPYAYGDFEYTEEMREAQLGERALAIGSWGADVFTLQRHLRRLGFEIDADGLYGPQTRDAVRAFQREYGLAETGRVTASMLDVLNDALLRRVETMDYSVKPGDSLWAIARAFDTTMEVLVAMNDFPDRPLRVGEVIKVPALSIYTVQQGDTLSGIAHRFRTTVEAIVELNEREPDDLLPVGAQLKLPRGSFNLSPAHVD